MKCEIIRYKIRSEPFGEPKDCVRCVTHGWEAYTDQGGGVAPLPGATSAEEMCPVGRREAFERGPLPHVGVNALMQGSQERGVGWEDYLKQVEASAARERSQLVKLTEDIADMKATMAAQGERLAELLRIAQWLEAKGP